MRLHFYKTNSNNCDKHQPSEPTSSSVARWLNSLRQIKTRLLRDTVLKHWNFR